MKRSFAVVFRLICVRHGETSGNKELRIQGSIDNPLNDEGKEQARKAAHALRNVNLTRVYTSDLSRARTTCEIILEQNSHSVPPIQTELRVREKHFGTTEGMELSEIMKMAKEAGKVMATYNPPGAETNEECRARMIAFFKELCQSIYDKEFAKELKLSKEGSQGDSIDQTENENLKKVDSGWVLLVSHGAVLRQLFLFFHKDLQCPLPEERILKLSPNTGISEFLVEYTPRKYRLECIRFHDARHLDDSLNSATSI